MPKLDNPKVIRFKGLSGSGKSTVANELSKELYKQSKPHYVLDGDNLRFDLNRDLGFAEADNWPKKSSGINSSTWSLPTLLWKSENKETPKGSIKKQELGRFRTLRESDQVSKNPKTQSFYSVIKTPMLIS